MKPFIKLVKGGLPCVDLRTVWVNRNHIHCIYIWSWKEDYHLILCRLHPEKKFPDFDDLWIPGVFKTMEKAEDAMNEFVESLCSD